jgi:hypothetical protein
VDLVSAEEALTHHEKADTVSSRGVIEPRNETGVVGTSIGDTDCRRGGVTIVEFPITSIHFCMSDSENIKTKTTL